MVDRHAPTHDIDARCPHCGKPFEYATGTTGRRPPADGDVAICWGCHRLAVFVAGPLGVALRLPTTAEQELLRRDPRVRATLGTIAEAYDPQTAGDLAYEGGAG